MDEDKKKVVMIVIILFCIGLAAGITYWANTGGSGVEKATIPMACFNEECGYTTELTAKEFEELLEEKPTDSSSIMSIAPSTFECPECGEMSLYPANKCEKCGEIFLTDPASRDYPDRCPNCGHSKMEQRAQASRESRRRD